MDSLKSKDNFKLFCCILGSDRIFPVDIAKSETVGDLKKAIKKKKEHELAHVDADALDLWQVSLPIDASLQDKLKLNKLVLDKGLKSWDELSEVFSDNPPARKLLHIVVQSPPAAAQKRFRSPSDDDGRERRTPFHNSTPPNTPPQSLRDGGPFQHTPSKPRKEFDSAINSFLEKCRPTMRELVAKAGHVVSLLPSWKPMFLPDDEFAQHFSTLSIPAIDGKPSLLLDGLGEVRHELDRQLAARIPDIFSCKSHTVLVNTSGSGKTRLVLEGLCRSWGFYFVAKPDSTGIGSLDLYKTIESLGKAHDYQRAKLAMKSGGDIQVARQHICEAADHRFAQLLLARFLLLNLLIEEAQNIPGGLQEKEHRRLWVLLQVQPQIFFPDDIFVELSRLLRHASTDDLKDRITQQYNKFAVVLPKVRDPDTNVERPTPIYQVLDEGQVTTTLRRGDFMSGDGITPQSMLQPWWLFHTAVLERFQMRLVLSGTGIDLAALRDDLSSSALKPEHYDLKFDIGAFEGPDSQTAYIKRYLPEHWTEPRWQDFLTRAWGWFRGRHRSTATLVSLILQGGYSCPHRTIDEYVEAFADFRPTDGKEWADHEPHLPSGLVMRSEVAKLNFAKMSETQASMLAHVIYDQILYGRYALDRFSSEERATFIQYGFARRKSGTQDIVLDEPIAVLAALHWVNKQAGLSLFKCLRLDIGKHSTRRNGWETYLAFHLRKVFEEVPKLDSVFTFRSDFAGRKTSDLSWQHENFELVTAVNANSQDPLVSVVTPSSGPSSNIGLLAHSGEDVIEWITVNEGHYALCFPPESCGPDVLFYVRSEKSRRLLLVAVQCKQYQAVALQTLIKGVRTLTPSWFWKSKDKKHSTAAEAPFITNDGNDCANLFSMTKASLSNIPHSIKVAGADYPVLRVFASWPADAGLERTLKQKTLPKNSKQEETKKKQTPEELDKNVNDPDKHPLASLHLKNFTDAYRQLDMNWFRGDVEQKMVIPAKRVLAQGDSLAIIMPVKKWKSEK